MKTDVDKLSSYLDAVKKSRYRSLVVLHAQSLPELLSATEPVLAGRGACLIVAPRKLRIAVKRCKHVSPEPLEKLLGLEYDYVVIATHGFLRPNLVAALAGIVKAGGSLIIEAPRLEEWNPGPPGGRRGYRRYLLESLHEAETIYWSEWGGNTILVRFPARKAGEWLRKPLHRHRRCKLAALTLTEDQAKALHASIEGLRRGARSILVTGDRGRGKSYLLGLLAAAAIREGIIGEAVATAPTPWQMASMFKGLLQGLRYTKTPHRTVERNDTIIAIKGPWGRVVYMPPDQARPAGTIIVDEAASIGLARLRSLSWRSGRTLAATTLHGYEGSGKAFAQLAKDTLPRPIVEVSLKTPIRYPPDDPLEAWLTKVFVLDPDPPPPPTVTDKCTIEILNTGRAHKEIIRALAKLLFAAHYRSEPDYLLTLLESTNHMTYFYQCNGSPIAVADTAEENPGEEEPARLSLKLLEVQLASAGLKLKPRLRTLRIVRIAVHPALQRRGIGTRLLTQIEEQAKSRHYDAITAVFSRHDVIPFWAKNGYILYYVSPRYNKTTGEKNLAFAKSLSLKAQEIYEQASAKARRKLVLAAHSVYRDLAAEKIAVLISLTRPINNLRAMPLPEDINAIINYINNLYDVEQVMDSIYLLTTQAFLSKNLEEILDERETIVLIARVLQGKSLQEAAQIVATPKQEVKIIIKRAVMKLLNHR